MGYVSLQEGILLEIVSGSNVQEGPLALYKGFAATFARQCPYASGCCKVLCQERYFVSFRAEEQDEFNYSVL